LNYRPSQHKTCGTRHKEVQINDSEKLYFEKAKEQRGKQAREAHGVSHWLASHLSLAAAVVPPGHATGQPKHDPY
jgi:hypothetical protein